MIMPTNKTSNSGLVSYLFPNMGRKGRKGMHNEKCGVSNCVM